METSHQFALGFGQVEQLPGAAAGLVRDVEVVAQQEQERLGRRVVAGRVSWRAVALVIRVFIATGTWPPEIAVEVLLTFFYINLALVIFNLIPIPPLDGSRVVGVLMNVLDSWIREMMPTRMGELHGDSLR